MHTEELSLKKNSHLRDIRLYWYSVSIYDFTLGRSFSLGIFGGVSGNTTRASAGKSAVEMLEASKSLYVKSAQVRERKQEPTFSGILQVTSLSTGSCECVAVKFVAAHLS